MGSCSIPIIPSEQIKSRPEPRVGGWLYAQPEESLFQSAITIGELRTGVVLLPPGKRRTELKRWLDQELIPRFFHRILPVTQAIGNHWGVLNAKSHRRGQQLNTADGLIAATALEHHLIVVTRNLKDFSGLDISLFNPWDEQGS